MRKDFRLDFFVFWVLLAVGWGWLEIIGILFLNLKISFCSRWFLFPQTNQKNLITKKLLIILKSWDNWKLWLCYGNLLPAWNDVCNKTAIKSNVFLSVLSTQIPSARFQSKFFMQMKLLFTLTDRFYLHNRDIPFLVLNVWFDYLPSCCELFFLCHTQSGCRPWPTTSCMLNLNFTLCWI